MGLWGKWIAAALVVCSAQAAAQTPSAGEPTKLGAAKQAAHAPSPDDICHAVEQAAGEYGLPVEFFARVIWQVGWLTSSAS